jgi:hypothetical protein
MMKNTAPPIKAGICNERALRRALRVMTALARHGLPDKTPPAVR